MRRFGQDAKGSLDKVKAEGAKALEPFRKDVDQARRSLCGLQAAAFTGITVGALGASAAVAGIGAVAVKAFKDTATELDTLAKDSRRLGFSPRTLACSASRLPARACRRRRPRRASRRSATSSSTSGTRSPRRALAARDGEQLDPTALREAAEAKREDLLAPTASASFRGAPLLLLAAVHAARREGLLREPREADGRRSSGAASAV
ncbi:hypothetical protein [Tianweitania sediminis]|uniref:Uncharacterized protein n=1 Tax=Tianweitania sediminis TaxID=1502156 RepID=A0A8J7R011_9HYPH|nr:hypothetical protein [Tianweitania sediminis]MBP0439973.1 hypothetical protein [Tianweitania sediminis]